MKKLLLGLFLFSSINAVFAQTSASPANTPPKTETAATAPAAPAKIDPAKKADIRTLLALTGADNRATEMMNGMLTTLKPLMTNSLPPGEYRDQLIDLFLEKFRSKNLSKQIIELAIPSYDKHFSDDDVKQLIAFYESPIGKKTATVQPQMEAEMQQAASALGKQLGRESMTEVLAEHPELKQAMEQASKSKSQ